MSHRREVVREGGHGLHPAAGLEGDHRPVPVAQEPGRHLVVRVRGEARVADPLDLLVRLEECRQRGGVRGALRGTERQRPDAAQDEERGERAGRLAERVHLLADRVQERLGARDHAAHRVAVAGEVLRGGVEDEVRAVLEGPEQRRAEERVVRDDQEAVAVRQLGERRQVRHPEARVRRRLHEQDLRLGADRGLDGGEVAHVGGRHRDAAPRQVVLPQDPGDREQLVANHDVVAGVEVREQRATPRPPCPTRTRRSPPRPRATRPSPRAPGSSGCRSASRSTTSGPTRAPGRPRPPSRRRCRRRRWPWRRSACCGRGWWDPAARPRGSPAWRSPSRPSVRACRPRPVRACWSVVRVRRAECPV